MKKIRVWLILFVALYFALYIVSSFTLLEKHLAPDYIDMTIEGLLFLASFILFCFFQRFHGPYRIYSNITIGLILTAFYHVSDMLDEVRVYPRFIGYVVDDATHLISLVFVIVGVYRWLSHNDKMLKDLKSLATTDGLTGAYNRQQIDKILEDQRAGALRYSRDLTVVLLDIDKFKAINDTYGHPVGDLVLKEMTQLIKGFIRETDYLGRYGGEEFLLILPETKLGAAQGVADKLREKIEHYDFAQVHQVTSSFGVASLKEKESLTDLVHRADQALYESKSKGRNLVSIAG